MMQVDPAPGLRVRVVDRLQKRPARLASPLAFASAAALIVIVLASIALLREVRRENTIQSAATPPAVSEATTVASPAVSPSPQPQRTTPSAVPAPDRGRSVEPRALPRPSVIFDGARDRVSAANVRPETTAAADAPSLPMPDTFVPFAPIVIAPISIAPIVIPPLTVPPLSDRK
jgi:hypothetical protein